MLTMQETMQLCNKKCKQVINNRPTAKILSSCLVVDTDGHWEFHPVTFIYRVNGWADMWDG